MSLPAQPFQNALLTTPINEATSQRQPADQTPFNFQSSFFDSTTDGMNFSPLSTSMPFNQQQIIGYALSPTSPSTQFLMAGSEGMPPPFLHNHNLDGAAKSVDVNQAFASNLPEFTPITEVNSTFTTACSPLSTNTTECFQTLAWSPSQLSLGFDDRVVAGLPSNQAYSSQG
jgi:hypothetical protein